MPQAAAAAKPAVLSFNLDDVLPATLELDLDVESLLSNDFLMLAQASVPVPQSFTEQLKMTMTSSPNTIDTMDFFSGAIDSSSVLNKLKSD